MASYLLLSPGIDLITWHKYHSTWPACDKLGLYVCLWHFYSVLVKTINTNFLHLPIFPYPGTWWIHLYRMLWSRMSPTYKTEIYLYTKLKRFLNAKFPKIIWPISSIGWVQISAEGNQSSLRRWGPPLRAQLLLLYIMETVHRTPITLSGTMHRTLSPNLGTGAYRRQNWCMHMILMIHIGRCQYRVSSFYP